MPETKWEVLQGDCIEVLKGLPEASMDAVVTDPPYGLSAHTVEDVRDALRAWIDGKPYVPKRAGFMGREWDAFVPGPEVWKEVLRVLKPGGHLLVFAGTRTQDLMGMAVRLSGFDARDTVMVEGLINWCYGCLSEDTEILVEGQWEPYHRAIAGLRALCYDAERDTFTWQPIDYLYTYAYNDTAYRLWSGATDQIVSRNHRCLVDRDGRWTTTPAEDLGQETVVPVVEDVCGLLDAIPLPQCGTVAREANMQSQVPRKTGLQHETCCAADPPGEPQGHDGADLSCLRQPILAEQRLDSEGSGSCLFKTVQRDSQGPGMGEVRPCWGGSGDPGRAGVREGEDDGTSQPGLEGRGDVRPQARELRGGEVHEVPLRTSADGSQGRLRDGTQAPGGSSHGKVSSANGDGASRQPRPDGQPAGEPGDLHVEPGTQAVRASRFTTADLVRVEPVHYTGTVWCVKVPTGAFVARRNGKVFVTGNSGFPKSKNVSLAIDKGEGHPDRGRAIPTASTHLPSGKYAEESLTSNPVPPYEAKTEDAKKWEGWGTALKPAQEPILVFRKPLRGTVAENVLTHGTGAMNIDACRVGYTTVGNGNLALNPHLRGTIKAGAAVNPTSYVLNTEDRENVVNQLGRWPSNLVLTHSPGCRQVGTRKVPSNNVVLKHTETGAPTLSYSGGLKRLGHGEYGYAGADGTVTVPDWECEQGCPVKALDDQSHGGGMHSAGTAKTSVLDAAYKATSYDISGERNVFRYGDVEEGANASRFFPQFSYNQDDLPVWECQPGCPVRTPDDQAAEAGVHSAGSHQAPQVKWDPRNDPDWSPIKDKFWIGNGPCGGRYGDSNASRFFPQFGYESDDVSFFYTPKASRGEREAGCDTLPRGRSPVMSERCRNCGKGRMDGRREGACCENPDYEDTPPQGLIGNHHPTVKPISLIRWLIRLVTPPGGRVLDPFTGSGTTGCAAMRENVSFTGIEREPEYVVISRARIGYQEIKAKGGVPNPWEKPVQEEEKPAEPTSLEDLFGFGEPK